MDSKAKLDLINIFRESLRLSGASIEMRVRRFASVVRPEDPDLAHEIAPLLGSMRGLREAAASAPLDADARQQLLVREDEIELAHEPVFAPPIRASLERVVRERQQAEVLRRAALRPVRSLLMSGKPGVGKTLTARWLARELSVPLLTLDLATVISSYLGKTGSNIRSVLQHAQAFPCVLLLDEFDAIAKRRDDALDVGELKRLVTVLLQTIDEWPSESLLVAATNHGELLDPAIWRRFDVVLELPLPSLEERRTALAALGVQAPLAQLIALSTEGETVSMLEKAVANARKRGLLDREDFQIALEEEVAARRSAPALSRRGRRPRVDDKERERLQELARRGLSAREIAGETGYSHTTVNRVLKRTSSGRG
jgi:SpoVK/Ycf46/Vps4 family AAA+-type ATPase